MFLTFRDNFLSRGKANSEAIGIISIDLFMKGLSFRQIQDHLFQIYNIRRSSSTIYRLVIQLNKILVRVAKNTVFESSSTWHADEFNIKEKGKLRYLWNILDYERKRYIVSVLTKRRGAKEAEKAIREAIKQSQTTPTKLVTDGLESYAAALKRMDLGIEHQSNVSLRDKRNNNGIERLHNSIRGWVSTKRGLKRRAGELLNGWRVYYDLLRPHMSLQDGTPIRMPDGRWLPILASVPPRRAKKRAR